MKSTPFGTPVTTTHDVDLIHTHVIVPDNKSPVEKMCIFWESAPLLQAKCGSGAGRLDRRLVLLLTRHEGRGAHPQLSREAAEGGGVG